MTKTIITAIVVASLVSCTGGQASKETNSELTNETNMKNGIGVADYATDTAIEVQTTLFL